MVNIHRSGRKVEVFETSGALEGKPCSNSAVYMHVTGQVNKSCVLILILDISHIFLILIFMIILFVFSKR